MKGKVETVTNRVPESHLSFPQKPGLPTPISKNLIFGGCLAHRAHASLPEEREHRHMAPGLAGISSPAIQIPGSSPTLCSSV